MLITDVRAPTLSARDMLQRKDGRLKDASFLVLAPRW